MNIVAQERKDQFAEVVTMIQRTKSEVIRLANTSLIDLYWRIGQYISNKIAVSEWGDGVVKQLAEYIEKSSPDTKGFSDKNLSNQLDEQFDYSESHKVNGREGFLSEFMC